MKTKISLKKITIEDYNEENVFLRIFGGGITISKELLEVYLIRCMSSHTRDLLGLKRIV